MLKALLTQACSGLTVPALTRSRHPIRGDVAAHFVTGATIMGRAYSILDETSRRNDAGFVHQVAPASFQASSSIADYLFPFRSGRIIKPPMPGFEDSAIIVLLALLLFGPKKLPVLARQFGKLMADFRRASSEFRTQMEDELRLSEQAERQKQLAAAPTPTPATEPAQAIEAEAAYAGHELPSPESSLDSATGPSIESEHGPSFETTPYSTDSYPVDSAFDSAPEPALESTAQATPETAPSPPPIATSGELSIQPPPTGLPMPHSSQAILNGAIPNASEDEAPHG